MRNSNMIIYIFMFYYQKKGIPLENPFLFRKEFSEKIRYFFTVEKYQFYSHLICIEFTACGKIKKGVVVIFCDLNFMKNSK